MNNKMVALHVYGYADGVETCLGTVQVDMTRSECPEYLHDLVQEQLHASLDDYEEACFMDDRLHDLRESYQGDSDEEELLSEIERDGHCADYIKLCEIGTDDEYAEEDRGFWEC